MWPASIAPNDSSHPEYVTSKNYFSIQQDIPNILEILSANLSYYKAKINVQTMADVADRYLQFASSLENVQEADIKSLKLYLKRTGLLHLPF